MTARLEDDTLDLLKDLQEKLHMDRLPLEIELFDNAHTQGQDAVGGMVTYVNGKKLLNYIEGLIFISRTKQMIWLL